MKEAMNVMIGGRYHEMAVIRHLVYTSVLR